MILIKPGVRLTGLTPQALLLIFVAENCYEKRGVKCVVTSVVDGKHMPGSRHYVGNGVDFRTHDLRAASVNPVHVIQDMRDCLGQDYDVILEAAGGGNEHIHGEWDPK